jgi:hypothetical protein
VPLSVRPWGSDTAGEVDGESWHLIVDWRDGSLEDAHAALRAVLTEAGVEPSAVSPDDMQIDYGSRRANGPPSGYFRVFVKRTVLGT